MEPPIPESESRALSVPAWLQERLVPDARFARAYDALGDDRRALLKSVIARHYALNPPLGTLHSCSTERLPLLERSVVCEPVSFAVLLGDESLDAPALFLAALVPALCARVPEVLAVRLGKRSDIPDPLLVACELSGQERLASLGPVQLERLVLDCAASEAPGVLLYPDTPAFLRLLARPRLRQALQTSPLRLVPLRLPRSAGLWRDSGQDFPPEAVSLLYGALPFEAQGVEPGQRGAAIPDASAWEAFRAVPRDLLLVPARRAGQSRAVLTVSGDCLGLWRWPELYSGVFVHQRQAFTST